MKRILFLLIFTISVFSTCFAYRYDFYVGNEPVFGNNNYKKSSISSIEIVKFGIIPSDAIDSWTYNFDDLSLNCWITNDDNYNHLFIGCDSEIYAPVDSTDLFKGYTTCSSIKNLSYINTSKVTSMKNMFAQCSAISKLDLSNFNTSAVTDMSGMFAECSFLTQLDVSTFDTSNVTDMTGMFQDTPIITLNISNFDFSNVKDLTEMFYGCEKLASLRLDTSTLKSDVKMIDIFKRCSNLQFNFRTICSRNSTWSTNELLEAFDNELIPFIVYFKDYKQNITRAEFAHLALQLYDALGNLRYDYYKDNPFTDTTDKTILYAYEVGITKGTSDTTFSPNEFITREQLATMLYRTLLLSGINTDIDITNDTFLDDSSISDWAKEAVYYMSTTGLVKGMGENEFAPLNNASIEQSLLISNRIFDTFVNKPFTMGNYVGISSYDAEQEINKHVGSISIKYEYSSDMKDGYVISQDPQPNTIVKPTDKITLVINSLSAAPKKDDYSD